MWMMGVNTSGCGAEMGAVFLENVLEVEPHVSLYVL